jgi:hypothetical protein
VIALGAPNILVVLIWQVILVELALSVAPEQRIKVPHGHVELIVSLQ